MPHRNTLLPLLILCVAVAGCRGTKGSSAHKGPVEVDAPQTPAIEFAPETYAAVKATAAPRIDGRLDDEVWTRAPWTADYVDIVGPSKAAPRFRTRGKMAWDDTHFYFAAEMEEPHLWATYTKRDSIVYHENDWEIFIDPDGDTHDYFEFEVNVLNTMWDLFLVRPYRDGGPALHQWDSPGLRHAIHADGTINDSTDIDRGWSVEVAIPWADLAQGADARTPPRRGDTWRVNFSRVQWQTRRARDQYMKLMDGKTGKPLPEDNWVWSPQGAVAMHMPEMWGIVQFVGETSPDEPVDVGVLDDARWWLRRLYYAQQTHAAEHGRYTTDFDSLGLERQVVRDDGYTFMLDRPIEVSTHGFEATALVMLGWHKVWWLTIREDGSVHVRGLDYE